MQYLGMCDRERYAYSILGMQKLSHDMIFFFFSIFFYSFLDQGDKT